MTITAFESLPFRKHAYSSDMLNIGLTQALAHQRDARSIFFMEYDKSKPLPPVHRHIIAIYFGNHNLTAPKRSTNHRHMTIMFYRTYQNELH